jgi:hypothetical protein
MTLPKTHLVFEVPDTGFSCPLVCDRPCAFPLKGGRTCRRASCKAIPFCWQHSRKVFGVKVERTAYGDGLRAMRDFRRGEYIAPYGGLPVTEDELSRRYDLRDASGDIILERTAPYAFNDTDAACKRGLGALANDGLHGPTGSRRRVNARLEHGMTESRARRLLLATGLVDDDANILLPRMMIGSRWLRATKAIKRNQPILVSYGDAYWLGGVDGQVSYRVRRRARNNLS